MSEKVEDVFGRMVISMRINVPVRTVKREKCGGEVEERRNVMELNWTEEDESMVKREVASE